MKKIKNIRIIVSIIIVFFIICSTQVMAKKVKLPADLKISLPPANRGDINTIIVEAKSYIPFKTGNISLDLSSNLENYKQTNILWEGSSDSTLNLTLNYQVALLDTGKYHFRAWFEFISLQEETIKISQNLYVNVREADILSSNISFLHIKRIELKKKIEKMGFSNMSIDQIQIYDPDLADEVRNLNKLPTIDNSSAIFIDSTTNDTIEDTTAIPHKVDKKNLPIGERGIQQAVKEEKKTEIIEDESDKEKSELEEEK